MEGNSAQGPPETIVSGAHGMKSQDEKPFFCQIHV